MKEKTKEEMKEKMKEKRSDRSQFWGDVIAEDIIRRSKKSGRDSSLKKDQTYFVYDEKTPSGEIHIGSARGWVIHDVITKCLLEKGVKAKFVLSSDDYDPFDKPIKNHPEWDKYLGKPFKHIPSPVEGYESWADYYFRQCTDLFEDWGIDAELESTGEEYEKGTFNNAIKSALDNSQKIKNIFERIYNKPYNKLPFNPICEKCGKIGTTVVTEWDSERELITYECREDAVDWAKGCGHTGTASPYNGAGKLPWKVEWPAKWVSKGVDVEFAGKDHFTKGGSRTVGIAISDEVFDYDPPYPSTRKKEGPGYEFLNVGGRKMSTSKGRGAGFAAMSRRVPPKILRFLMVSYKPTSVIDFDPHRPNDLMILYDRYDRAERIYFGQEENKRAEELKRIYELSHIGPIPKKLPPQVSLRHAAMVVQLAKDDEEAIEILQKQGVFQELDEEGVAYLKERFAAARQWLKEFAPESEKYVIQERTPENLVLNDKEKESLSVLAERLEKNQYDEKSLFDEFYKICEEKGIKNTEFFRMAYKVLLGKERGPKLAKLILFIGQKRSAELLKQAITYFKTGNKK